MIEFPLRLLDPEWYFFRKMVREQKKYPPLKDQHGWYYLTLMHRGENFLYTDENGSTYVAVGVIPPCFAAANSIKKWNYLWKVTEAQRKIVVERVAQYFEERNDHCRIVEEDKLSGAVLTS